MALLRGFFSGQHIRLARSDAHLFARYPCEAVSRLFDSVCVGICCLLGLDAAGSGTVSQLVVGLDDEAEQNAPREPPPRSQLRLD